MKPDFNRTGFSLTEMALALAVSGVMLGGVWQLVGITTASRDAQIAVTQAQAVAVAAQNYINNNKSDILGLADLATLGSVTCLKVTDADSCATALSSLQAKGFLPSGFVNQNNFGQSYVVYVRREDDGTIGAADADDRIVGLVLTTGGIEIADKTGRQIVGMLGAGAGFIYDGDDIDAVGNSPGSASATAVRGAGGGWSIDLTQTGWSSIGSAAQQGHIAMLTNLIPARGGSLAASTGSTGGSTIVTALDGMNDAITDYANLSMYMGDGAGTAASVTLGAQKNTALGYHAMAAITTGNNNTAMGAYALTALTTGSDNTAMGAYALTALQTGSGNTAMGTYALANSLTSYNTALGQEAARYNTGTGITAVGYRALLNNTADYTVGVGAEVLKDNTGLGNTAVGSYALTANQTGNYNVAVGHNALATATAADYNVAIGAEAMYYTTGSYNVAVGYQAGRSITSGTYNTVFGYQAYGFGAWPTGTGNFAAGSYALQGETTGDYNVAIGHQALYTQTGVTGTVAFGYKALYSNLAPYNVALGYQALMSNSAGQYNVAGGSGSLTNGDSSYNTALGYNTLNASNGGSNTAVGYNALVVNTAAENVAVGYTALDSNTSGTANTAVGTNALTAITTVNYNTAAGYNALAANTAAENVAVGSTALDSNTSGTANTAVGANALTAVTTTSSNTAVGYNALTATTGTGNTAVGSTSGNAVSTGSGNTLIGYKAGATNGTLNSVATTAITTGSNNTLIGYLASVGDAASNNSVVIGASAATAITNTIYIGNGSGSKIGGAVAWSNYSDRRLKKDIEDSDLGLDFIMALKPVQFHLNDGNNRWDFGFIAQDVQKALAGRQTNIVFQQAGMYRMTSGELIAPAIKAMQQQQTTYVALETSVADLERELSKLNQKLDAGEKLQQDLLAKLQQLKDSNASLRTQLGAAAK